MSDIFQRQAINDPNAQRNLNALSVNVRNPGQTVGQRDVSGMTRNADQLAGALSNLGNAAGRKIEEYVTKKNKQAEIEGAIARAQGNTELELQRSGNKSFRQGWQSMDVRVAQNAVKARELDFLETQGGELTPAQYQERLNGIMKETTGNLQGLSPEVQDIVYQGTMDLVPDLVARQTIKHNEYNRLKSKETGTKALVSTALVDGPEAAVPLLDRSLYPGMTDTDYNEMVTDATVEALSLGKPGLTDAVIQAAPKSGVPLKVAPVTKNLREIIGRAESSGNYNSVYGLTTPIDLSSLTVRDVQQMQEQMKAGGAKSTAVGKYQFISGTLTDILPKAGISPDEKFTPEVQDKLADVLLEEAGLSKYISGEVDADRFQEALSKTWAGLPKDSSGLSYHAGDGLNAATVEHSELRAALGEASYNTQLTVAALSQGLTVDQVSKIQKARDAYTADNSTKLTAQRAQLEADLVERGVDATDESIIAQITAQKEANGYSDTWATSTFEKIKTARKEVYKTRAETDMLRSSVITGTVSQLSGEQQSKAIAIAKQDILQDHPDAANPDSPNFETALADYNKQLYTFLHKNNVVDQANLKYTGTLMSGNILDADGNVTKQVVNTYTGYRQGLVSTNDPAFMAKSVGTAAEVFVLADDILDSTGASMSAAQALKIAHAELSSDKALATDLKTIKRDDIKKLIDDSVNNKFIMEEFSDVMKKATITSIWDYAHMAMSPETSTNASTSLRAGVVPPSGSFDAAVQSPEILARLKIETARIAQNMQGYTGTRAQRVSAIKQAQRKLADRSEYVLGTLMVTEADGMKSLSSRLGLSDKRLGAHVALTDLLSNINEHVYGKDIPEEVFAPVTGEGFVKGVANLGEDIVKAPLRLYQQSQRMVDQGNVPDAHVMLDASQNNVIIQPYVDYDRTKMREPLVIPVEKLKEYAGLMRVASLDKSAGARVDIARNYAAGTLEPSLAQTAKDKWLEQFKTTLPQYKE